MTRAPALPPAVAAGVTAVFGAPVGGVLFSIEVTMTHYRVGNLWRAFICAVLCVSTFEALNYARVRVSFPTHLHAVCPRPAHPSPVTAGGRAVRRDQVHRVHPGLAAHRIHPPRPSLRRACGVLPSQRSLPTLTAHSPLLCAQLLGSAFVYATAFLAATRRESSFVRRRHRHRVPLRAAHSPEATACPPS